MAALLAVDHLRFARRGQSVLADISFDLEPGEIVCLIGPNGSGKSTLLRCLAGSLRPEAGTVRADDLDLVTMTARARAEFLAYAPQETAYSFAFTVAEFIGLSHHAGVVDPDRDLHAEDLFQRFDLAHLMDRSLLTLSGGERQRAAVARALLQPSPLILLDEPTAHLDLRHQKQLIHLLRDEVASGKRTVLLVLHDLNLAAAADRLLLLHQGKLIAHGTPSEVLTAPHLETAYATSPRIFVDELGRPIILSH